MARDLERGSGYITQAQHTLKMNLFKEKMICFFPYKEQGTSHAWISFSYSVDLLSCLVKKWQENVTKAVAHYCSKKKEKECIKSQFLNLFETLNSESSFSVFKKDVGFCLWDIKVCTYYHIFLYFQSTVQQHPQQQKYCCLRC